ncbi:MAG: hypothetical protein JSS73_14665 [Bacteroidetes bacterium]|nr:hypothetical protein [Bacteroidota bacterium]
MKDLKSLLKELITHTVHGKKIEVIKVLDFRIKDWDDNNGLAGEHYIANCIVKNPMDPKLKNVINEPIGASFLVELKLVNEMQRDRINSVRSERLQPNFEIQRICDN